MSNDKPIHQGPEHSAPYPVSRLAPAFHAPVLADEIKHAESMLSARTGAKLRVIVNQIKALQEEARKVLDEAREEQALNHARCSFKRTPGKTYHLYRKQTGESFFSMLSPDEWGGRSPNEFLGSYRLETDYSWTPATQIGDEANISDLVTELLHIGGQHQFTEQT